MEKNCKIIVLFKPDKMIEMRPVSFKNKVVLENFNPKLAYHQS